MRSHARSWRFTFVVMLALLLAAIAAPAAFAGPGSISGSVTTTETVNNEEVAVGLENILVSAVPASFSGSLVMSQDQLPILPVLTNEEGYYKINFLPEGWYNIVAFDRLPWPLQWATQWFTGVPGPGACTGAYDWPHIPAAGADAVYVNPNMDTDQVNFSMVPASALGGTVLGRYRHDHVLYDGHTPKPAAGIQVWLWFPGCGIDWDDFVAAVQTGRWDGGPMGDTANDSRPHIPWWVLHNRDVTDEFGKWYIGPLEPRSYTVYYYDPERRFAPDWELVTLLPGASNLEMQETLDPGAEIEGWVHGDVGNDTHYNLPGVEVRAYLMPERRPQSAKALDERGRGLLMGVAWTDENGEYEIEGLPEGRYRVQFEAEGYNHFAETTDLGRGHHDLYYGHEEWVTIYEEGSDVEACALLMPIPHVKWVHPPFGVNDGPERWDTEVTVRTWGAYFIANSMYFEMDNEPYRQIHPFEVEIKDFCTVVLHLNLASPVALVGDYHLHYSWYHWNHMEERVYDSAFQVLNSYVPTTPATPPAPAATPTLPSAPVPSTPDTTPTTPDEPADPVAGPVTVAALQPVTVKKGALATLRFQVDEQVLGGTAEVKVVIMNKAGKVVKQVKAKVTMNAAASISFRCKLAKGSYSYTVSAGSASATSKLIVK